MKKSNHLLWPAILAIGLALGVSSKAFAAVTLVENGVPKAHVVLAASATEDERFAVEELVRYVEKATGARLPIMATARAGEPSVLVGLSALPESIRTRVRLIRDDGYMIEAGPVRVSQLDGRVMIKGDTDALILAGNGAHGTSFAVYEFLEKFAGVRWLWPGEVGEVVPRRNSLVIESVTLVKEPAFVWRSLGPEGTLWGPADRWQKKRELGISEEHLADMRLWERRNRFGGENIYGGHAFGEILPPSVYGPTNPEYYGLAGGKRDWENFNGKHRAQFCTSNPEVVRKTIEYCRRILNQRPELDGVSISPNDGRGFCECDPCTALDIAGIQPEGAGAGMGEEAARMGIITDRMMIFANQVAEGVERTHPGKKILFYAYSQFKTPPKRVRVHPNVVVQYTVNCSEFWDEDRRDTAFQGFAGWTNVAPTFGVYEYFTQMNSPDLPRLTPDLIQLELAELQRLGARHFQTQAGHGFAVNGLNFYVLGRLLWDPSADIKAIQADYMNKAFGPAAPAMNRYFDRLIASWRDRKSTQVRMLRFSLDIYRDVLGAYPRELIDASRKDLEEAARLAGGEHRRRVEFVRDGFRYFEMTMDAAEASYPLLEAGWHPRDGLSGAGKVDQQQVGRAIELWRQRDRYVEEHREDFVLSYMWVRSNDVTRSFNPLRGLDRLSASEALY